MSDVTHACTLDSRARVLSLGGAPCAAERDDVDAGTSADDGPETGRRLSPDEEVSGRTRDQLGGLDEPRSDAGVDGPVEGSEPIVVELLLDADAIEPELEPESTLTVEIGLERSCAACIVRLVPRPSSTGADAAIDDGDMPSSAARSRSERCTSLSAPSSSTRRSRLARRNPSGTPRRRAASTLSSA